MQKPAGVVVIGALYLIGAVLLILCGVAAFGVGGVFLERAASMGMTMGRGIAGGVGTFIGVAAIVFGVIFLVIGIGLISLKNWARMIAMVLAGIFVVLGLLHMLPLMIHFAIFRVSFVLVRVAINALIVWYLNQPTVKQAFGA